MLIEMLNSEVSGQHAACISNSINGDALSSETLFTTYKATGRPDHKTAMFRNRSSWSLHGQTSPTQHARALVTDTRKL